MRIRSATGADAPGIAALLEELGYPVEVGRLSHRLRALLARDDYAVLVADRGQMPVGLGCAHVLPVLMRMIPWPC